MRDFLAVFCWIGQQKGQANSSLLKRPTGLKIGGGEMIRVIVMIMVLTITTANIALGRSSGSSRNNAGKATAATQVIQHPSVVERLAEVGIWFKEQYGEEKFVEAGKTGFYIHIDKTRTHSIVVILHWDGQMSVKESNLQDGSSIYSGRGMWYPKFIPPAK